MCGIAGYFTPTRLREEGRSLHAMAEQLAHRGPDDEGYVAFDTRRTLTAVPLTEPHDLAIAHRRFSIIDPSSEGRQPFWTRDQRICVAFNGEVYNYREIRSELEQRGHRFFTRSDTEVLAEAYRAWGTGAFAHLAGFWAVALFDVAESRFLLARDRLGKAPLYLTSIPGGFAFASEIKALRPIAERAALEPNLGSIANFAAHGWRDVHGSTFYSGISSFPAASFAVVGPRAEVEPVRFWEIPETRMVEDDIGPEQAVREFRHLFLQSVENRMHADVPVAFELSGGMDSSAIVAAACELGAHGNAYTVKWDEASADESGFASAVISRAGGKWNHCLLTPPATDFWNEADHYLWLMDEPFHAPNMLSHFRIWQKMADDGYRVTVHGGGGDELLAGYGGDFMYPYLRSRIRQGRFALAWREAASHSETRDMAMPRHLLEQVAGITGLGDLLRTKLRPRRRMRYLHLSPGMLHRGYRRDIHGRMVDLMGQWRMHYWLLSGNQSSMGVPIEARAPFLDHRLVDFVFTLPMDYLIREGWLKWLLRKAFEHVLPPEVVWRERKLGFPFPLQSWLLDSEKNFTGAMGRDFPPFLQHKMLLADYRRLATSDPLALWRLMSIAMWWKRSVLGHSLAA